MAIVQNLITKTLGIGTLVLIFLMYMLSREFFNNTNPFLIIIISQIFFLTNYIIKVNKKLNSSHLLLMINVSAVAHHTELNQLIYIIIASFAYAIFLDLYRRIKYLKNILIFIAISLNLFFFISQKINFTNFYTLGIVFILILIMRRSELSLFLVILFTIITVFNSLENDNRIEMIFGITLYSIYLIFSYNKCKERIFNRSQIFVLLFLYCIFIFQSDYSNYGSIKASIITLILLSVISLCVIFDNKYRLAKVIRIRIDSSIQTNHIKNLVINQQVPKQCYNNHIISSSICASSNLNYLFLGWKIGFNSHPLLNEDWFQSNLMLDKWKSPLMLYFLKKDKSKLSFSPWVVSNWFNAEYKINNSLSAFENYILQEDKVVLNPSPSVKRYEIMERLGIKNDLEPLEVMIIHYPSLLNINPIPTFSGQGIFRLK